MADLALSVPEESLRGLIREIVAELAGSMSASALSNAPLALTEEAAAEKIGLTADQLRNERRLGRIAYHRIGGRRVRYTEADLAEYLAARRTKRRERDRHAV
jgi:hypothetical protein